MTIQPIGKTAAALYFSTDDLREQDLRGEDVTPEQVLNLTRQALDRAGLSPGEPLEVEFWPDRCGLLVFVRRELPLQTVWAFADAEALLTAAAALHTAPPDHALYWWRDRFWLLGDKDCPSLAEFGDRTEGDPLLPARLREYGKLLLRENALGALREYF